MTNIAIFKNPVFIDENIIKIHFRTKLHIWNMWEYTPFIFFHSQYSFGDKIYEIQLYYPFSVLYLQHYFYIKFDPLSNILGNF